MRVDFDEFSEMIERACFNSWRSVIGLANEELITSVDSILFTRQEHGDKWEFSFALRVDTKWSQSKIEMEPIEFDPFGPIDPQNVEENMSPQNKASSISIDLLSNVAKKIGAIDVR